MRPRPCRAAPAPASCPRCPYRRGTTCMTTDMSSGRIRDAPPLDEDEPPLSRRRMAMAVARQGSRATGAAEAAYREAEGSAGRRTDGSARLAPKKKVAEEGPVVFRLSVSFNLARLVRLIRLVRIVSDWPRKRMGTLIKALRASRC